MFAAGKLGGGDVKLLAATGLWFDFHGALWMLICVAISGGILALVVLILRMIGWSEIMNGGLVTNTALMDWEPTGTAARGIQAATNQEYVVMTPSGLLSIT